MRVIVLYYGDSEGRYASEALAESFRSFGSQCTTVDVSAFSSRIGQAIERTVSFAVSMMNRSFHDIYRNIYRIEKISSGIFFAFFSDSRLKTPYYGVYYNC